MSEQVQFDPIRHEYRNAAGVAKPSVTWILAKSGLCDFSFVDDEVRERAMARGRSVHWMTRLEDEEALDYRKVPGRLRPYRKAYNNWKRSSWFVPEIIEQPFISPRGYAGTPDRIGSFPPTDMFPRGSRAVLDLKTGAVYEWTRYQIALYAVGVTKHIWQAKMLRRIALALRADGTHQVKEFSLSTWDSDFSIAMEALRRTKCQLQQ
jgi:hypothetical protein